ncbi:uncharacterized protein B0T23DRAFT_407833 [Neurospora hispaniola]|uniref:Uncharacterized protein n=1 Tax=Neurospora hispaniola TaxID=588809 RepID=A0AAJ0I144_9PEZI|nr:hypothetical protein B0T23DRAFT_407833 [Neurospora hispaniola]
MRSWHGGDETGKLRGDVGPVLNPDVFPVLELLLRLFVTNSTFSSVPPRPVERTRTNSTNHHHSTCLLVIDAPFPRLLPRVVGVPGGPGREEPEHRRTKPRTTPDKDAESARCWRSIDARRHNWLQNGTQNPQTTRQARDNPADLEPLQLGRARISLECRRHDDKSRGEPFDISGHGLPIWLDTVDRQHVPSLTGPSSSRNNGCNGTS